MGAGVACQKKNDVGGGHYVGHLSPFSTQVKNEWNILLLPLYASMAYTGTILHL
jgi:hypothetical protein